ncbi:hypothetical protein J6590_083706 [Homalodisca vitripennis]|nr:hypothetical protein J6590_083706 [Homalodisca vitripennis]
MAWRNRTNDSVRGLYVSSSSKVQNKNDGVLVYESERVSVSVRELELGDVYGMTVYWTQDSDLDNFTTALNNYYGDIINNKPYILVGNVNVNLILTDNKTERYMDVFYDAGFMCGIENPTTVVGESKTCIDHFNQYFSKVDSNLANAIDSSGPPVVDDTDYATYSTFTLHTVTEDVLQRHVNQLRGGSGPGYDGISASF